MLEIFTAILGLMMIAAGLVNVVCFCLIIYLMFQAEEVMLPVLCIVMVFCGLGGLIAFIFGWVDVGKYDAKKVMLIWTGAIAAQILLALLGAVVIPEP
ncbi:hypothetical protein Pan97_37340 [Bremerella volcania]|uniref:Uncharacterized protein n=1 Tax=Bremerella volcania TaxID=2527984 RepID=A0A518CBS3_9BACT|nr:hypothetical protein [Bremerella volcania]QDU76679.1 hypothetical protein Pan97_37340 [Bremerella volcania]